MTASLLRSAAFALLLALVPSGAAAEGDPGASREIERPPLTEEGRAYGDLAARRRVRAEVRYPADLDPSRLTIPDLRRPPSEAEAEAASDRERWLWAGGITALVLLIVALAIRFGGLSTIGFRRIGDGARGEDGELRAVIEAEGGVAGFLDRLRAMRDRPAALVLLIQGALERAGQITGIRVLRSQTAREVLRRLPPDWPHRDALGRIVRVEEVVQFGGRDLSEPVFEECLTLAEPLFGGSRR